MNQIQLIPNRSSKLSNMKYIRIIDLETQLRICIVVILGVEMSQSISSSMLHSLFYVLAIGLITNEPETKKLILLYLLST